MFGGAPEYGKPFDPLQAALYGTGNPLGFMLSQRQGPALVKTLHGSGFTKAARDFAAHWQRLHRPQDPALKAFERIGAKMQRGVHKTPSTEHLYTSALSAYHLVMQFSPPQQRLEYLTDFLHALYDPLDNTYAQGAFVFTFWSSHVRTHDARTQALLYWSERHIPTSLLQPAFRVLLQKHFPQHSPEDLSSKQLDTLFANPQIVTFIQDTLKAHTQTQQHDSRITVNPSVTELALTGVPKSIPIAGSAPTIAVFEQYRPKPKP